MARDGAVDPVGPKVDAQQHDVDHRVGDGRVEGLLGRAAERQRLKEEVEAEPNVCEADEEEEPEDVGAHLKLYEFPAQQPRSKAGGEAVRERSRSELVCGGSGRSVTIHGAWLCSAPPPLMEDAVSAPQTSATAAVI